MENNKIKIATSQPSLKDKIRLNIKDNTDTVHWYIKFNIPLDEDSVSQKSMDVTDTEGYIMRTNITYTENDNMIVISPLDSYQQDTYYLLNISRKVRSARGQNLKREIHILFKLINNRISEYKLLPPNVQPPKKKTRPRDYDEKYTKTKVYAFDTSIFDTVPQDKLPSADININIILGVAGLILTLASIPVKILAITIICAVICLAGIGHIIIQFSNSKNRSIIAYNKGVRRFNKEKYTEAQALFKKALELDQENEMAEYSLNKTSFYL